MASGAYTGYVHNLIDNQQDFPAFVWSCAKGFGYLYDMRDEPMGAPIRFDQPESYHASQLTQAKALLQDWDEMNIDEKIRLVLAERDLDVSRHRSRQAEREAEKAVLEDRLSEARAWIPPTEEHWELRRFVIGQLESAIKDASSDYYEREINSLLNRSDLVLVERKDQSLRRDVTYHSEYLAKDEERATARKSWLEALDLSIPYPAKEQAK